MLMFITTDVTQNNLTRSTVTVGLHAIKALNPVVLACLRLAFCKSFRLLRNMSYHIKSAIFRYHLNLG